MLSLPISPRWNITEKTMFTVEQEIFCHLASSIEMAKGHRFIKLFGFGLKTLVVILWAINAVKEEAAVVSLSGQYRQQIVETRVFH